jgi:hypothetical protein
MHPVHRFISICLGLWFVFVVAEPVPVHECAMHKPSAGAHQSAHTAQTVQVAHDAHGNHHVAQTPPSEDCHGGVPTEHSQQSQGVHLCLCLGCAAGSAPVAGAKPPAVVPVPAAIARLQAMYPRVERIAPEPEFILPPATAPPTLS